MFRFLGALALSTLVLCAQPPTAVAEKNFYLLSLIERSPDVRKLMPTGPAVYGKITPEQSEVMHRALAQAPSAFAKQLKASRMYVRYNALPDPEFLAKAWNDCAAGINHIIDVYAQGTPPRYPAIDLPTYDPTKPAGARLVETLAAVLADDATTPSPIFEPPLRFALGLLNINHRDEAGRLEPMEKGENAAALAAIATAQWTRYPYSVILVPGAGNDIPGVRLSGFGKLRVELAAKRYRDGKAPFILVSGGYVHPSQTPFAEALEMKHELMEKYGIPDRAILIDPHARHTTTNIRNAARIMYRYGMPFEAKAMITTDASQSASIESPAFERRCQNELGYMPLKVLKRLSQFDLEFVPVLDSLHIDPQDPLDP